MNGILEFTALILGFYMAWNIGANDVANAMGTSVGSKALTIGKAIFLAAILEFSGAFLAGSNVSETIQKGIIAPDFFAAAPDLFVLGMIGTLLSTGILLQAASYFSLPISTTHAIVGAVLGFGWFVGGVNAIAWVEVGWIALSWVWSPLCSGAIAFVLYSIVQRYSLVPANAVGAFPLPKEKLFVYLQIGSACLVAFAHGANDVSNAIGPVAAVLHVLKTHVVNAKSTIPSWLLAFGGIGMALGLAMWGWRVIETIGKKITELTPKKGFSAEIGAAATVLLASYLGFPVSTTHAVVGAILGVGLVRGAGALNWKMCKNIALSWIVTLPLCALLSIAVFCGLRCIFL